MRLVEKRSRVSKEHREFLKGKFGLESNLGIYKWMNEIEYFLMDRMKLNIFGWMK